MRYGSRIMVTSILSTLLISGMIIWLGRQHLGPFQEVRATDQATVASAHDDTLQVLELSPEAQRNLGLVVKPLKLQTYRRTVHIPGVIVDRPGQSDRGVSSPAVAVVARIHAYPGDAVRPGDKLFALRVYSEYLQNKQAELFKATREIQIINDEYKRLKVLAESGSIPGARLIELENELRRQNALIQAYRQDLLTRGLGRDQVEAVEQGTFVSSIEVVAPAPVEDITATQDDNQGPSSADANKPAFTYEVQEVRAELGQQVQAGQLLCVLANHQALYIEGHAFKQEAPLLERAAQNDWAITVEIAEDDASDWPPLKQDFQIHHLANVVDPSTRTFNFFIPLMNTSRSYLKNGNRVVVWRFRPGQRVRLNVPVEEFREVFVLPTGAVAREGPDVFVFRQNGNLFNRKPVRVVCEDRLNVVLAREAQIVPGIYVAQNAASSLNRVLKSQAASGTPVGVHVHADGTVHEAH